LKQDSKINIEGIRIWGSPWQPNYHEWAFMLERGEVIKKKWDLIPEGTDVLITHGPPASTQTAKFYTIIGLITFSYQNTADLLIRNWMPAAKTF
jgi:hypothetical protein